MKVPEHTPTNLLSNATSSDGFMLRDNPRESAMSLAAIVEPKDLSVVFQPIVDLHAGGRVFAHEVLTRCSKPEFKNPTALFARVVQGRCCGRLGRMIREIAIPLCSGVPLFVNVHPVELTEGWMVRPDDPVLSHDHDIYLEITESVSFSHFRLCMDVLKDLRSRSGVHLVVDDLGAGYSNLKRIADLEPAVVKIDIDLVRDIHLHRRQQLLVRAIVRLCVDLGAKVVAEGIETREELKAVIDTGAHYGQGYLLARPAFPIPTVYWPGLHVSSDDRLVAVAVPAPFAQALTYVVPDGMPWPANGARVAIEVAHRKTIGVVVSRVDEAPRGVDLKPVLAIVDEHPLVPPELLRFLLELSTYYLAPVGEVLRAALPPMGRSASQSLAGLMPERERRAVGRRSKYARATGKPLEKQKSAAAALLHAHLVANGEARIADLEKTVGSARAAIKRLVELGAVEVFERDDDRRPSFDDRVQRDLAPELTSQQRAAVAAIEASLDAGEGRTHLVFGITGSGKTEVYLHAIQHVLAQGRGALVLVPEIALTPQLVARYRARFGDDVSVLHSGLTDADRQAMWQRLRRGEVRAAIGARSALFAPVPELGLLVVDEEHEASFKQEDGVRYHARDMAILRAHRANAVCVLGSATPSVESYELSLSGRAELHVLPGRAVSSSMLPSVQIVNMRTTGPMPGGHPKVSSVLHKALVGTLERGEQAIIFLNRRGFSPSVICESCGEIVSCDACSVALTFHRRRGALICHYCDHMEAMRDVCTKCHAPALALEGLGTERLEEALGEALPGARIARLDRDTGGGARSEKILAKLRRGEIDVLVGTQMVAKGHDVPTVTLVGVIDADGALSMPDFRAAERTFQLLVQVAGRAGRGSARGTVVLQTRTPDHPAIALAAQQDVTAFLAAERRARAELAYPPFSRLAMIRIDAVEEEDARSVGVDLVSALGTAPTVRSRAVAVLGPAAAPLARLRGRYRFQLMLKAKTRPALRAALLSLSATLRAVPRRVRVVVDVDPVSML